MTGSQQLSLLLELELLYLGIQGKHALWRALNVVAADDPRLGEFNFDHLASRTEQQPAAVEEQRLSTAASALTS